MNDTGKKDERLDPMDAWEDMLENTSDTVLFYEFIMTGSATLADLTATEKQQLYTAVETALRSIDCPVQAIRASGRKMHLIVQQDLRHSIDEVASAIEIASRGAVVGRNQFYWVEYGVQSLSPWNVIDHVIRVRGLQ